MSETKEQAQKRRSAYCKEYGHSWIRNQCSYCGATRKPEFIAQPPQEKKP